MGTATAWAEIDGVAPGLFIASAPSFTPITDSFNRANGAIGTTDTGQTWVAQSGTWTIVSNQAASSGNQCTCVVDAAVADCTMQVTLVNVSGSGETGVCWRSTDDSNHFLVNKAGTTYRKQAGSFTAVASGAASADGDVVKVTLSGSSHTLLKNGSAWMSFTDSFNSTATKHGLRGHNNSTPRWDDFSVVVP